MPSEYYFDFEYWYPEIADEDEPQESEDEDGYPY